MAMSREKATMITVNYNSTKYLNRLLRSVEKIKNELSTVIIIDNNTPKFQEELVTPKKLTKIIRIIKNRHNIGFSKGVNMGIALARSNLILLLNPDTFLPNRSVVKTLDKIRKDKNIGIISGTLIDEKTGCTQLSVNMKPTFMTALFEFTNLKKLIPNNPFTKRFWPQIDNVNKKIMEVDAVCGAYMIFRKKHKNKTNTFDENYFLYLEDLDFGISAKNRGVRVLFDAESTVVHTGGASSGSIYNIELKNWYKSRRYFFQKYLTKPQGFIISIVFNMEEKLLKILHKITNTPEF